MQSQLTQLAQQMMKLMNQASSFKADDRKHEAPGRDITEDFFLSWNTTKSKVLSIENELNRLEAKNIHQVKD